MTDREYDCGVCQSKRTTDLTNGRDVLGPNVVCHSCGAHFWQGKWYTKSEWEVYVNEATPEKTQ